MGQGEEEKANLRKAVIGGNLTFGIEWWGANQSGSSSGKSCGKILLENLAGKSCGKFLWENLAGKSCGKILLEILAGKSCEKMLLENLVGKSCGTGRRGKSQFKKGSDWWKFNIWNRVMGSQPIRIQLGKILRENLVGKSLAGQGGGEKANLRKAVIGGNLAFGIEWSGVNQSGSSSGTSCRKFLRENLAGKILQKNLAGNSCGKFLWENLVGKSCRKFLQEILAGKCCGKMLQEIVAGKCCGKFLWENLANNSAGNLVRNPNGNSCRKILQEILREILREMLGDFPHSYSKLFLKVIFKIYNSSRSTLFSLVNL